MELERIELNIDAGRSCDDTIIYERVVAGLCEKGLTVSVAESCTGGLIGKSFTDVSGASATFVGGMITYTNNIKINKLGVSAETVDRFTEVSFECAAEMAERARVYFESDIGVSATGFAGPVGGNEKDPVGTVYLGISAARKTSVFRISFGNIGREEIRLGVAGFAAKALEEFVL